MRSVIVAAVVAFVVSIFGTPIAIKAFTRLRADQRSGQRSPDLGKKGTPTIDKVVSGHRDRVCESHHLTSLPDNRSGHRDRRPAWCCWGFRRYRATGFPGRLPEGRGATAPGSTRPQTDRADLLSSFFIVAMYYPSHELPGLPLLADRRQQQTVPSRTSTSWTSQGRRGDLLHLRCLAMSTR
jgi:hypothetical protein